MSFYFPLTSLFPLYHSDYVPGLCFAIKASDFLKYSFEVYLLLFTLELTVKGGEKRAHFPHSVQRREN